MGEDIGSLADRHRIQLDALRNNISTAPAGVNPRVHRKIVSTQHSHPQTNLRVSCESVLLRRESKTDNSAATRACMRAALGRRAPP
jgi:hypothetical protein